MRWVCWILMFGLCLFAIPGTPAQAAPFLQTRTSGLVGPPPMLRGDWQKPQFVDGAQPQWNSPWPSASNSWQLKDQSTGTTLDSAAGATYSYAFTDAGSYRLQLMSSGSDGSLLVAQDFDWSPAETATPSDPDPGTLELSSTSPVVSGTLPESGALSLSAALNASVPAGYESETYEVILNASVGNPASIANLSYDGGQVSGSFSAAGTYQVIAQAVPVGDANLLASSEVTLEFQVAVFDQAPQAVITQTTLGGDTTDWIAGSLCGLSGASSTDDGALQYMWELRDPAGALVDTGESQSFGMVPDAIGTWQATLVVRDAGGQTDSASFALQVRYDWEALLQIDGVTRLYDSRMVADPASADPSARVLAVLHDSGEQLALSLMDPWTQAHSRMLVRDQAQVPIALQTGAQYRLAGMMGILMVEVLSPAPAEVPYVLLGLMGTEWAPVLTESGFAYAEIMDAGPLAPEPLFALGDSYEFGYGVYSTMEGMPMLMPTSVDFPMGDMSTAYCRAFAGALDGVPQAAVPLLYSGYTDCTDPAPVSLMMYDMESDYWAQRSASPVSFSSGFVQQEFGEDGSLVLLGLNTSTGQASAYRYLPDVDGWELLGDVPGYGDLAGTGQGTWPWYALAQSYALGMFQGAPRLSAYDASVQGWRPLGPALPNAASESFADAHLRFSAGVPLALSVDGGQLHLSALRSLGPQVVQTIPADEQIEVGTALAQIELQLDKPIDASSLQADQIQLIDLATGSAVSGMTSWDAGLELIRFVPDTALNVATSYRVRLQPGVRDAEGLPIFGDGYQFDFATLTQQLLMHTPGSALQVAGGLAQTGGPVLTDTTELTMEAWFQWNGTRTGARMAIAGTGQTQGMAMGLYPDGTTMRPAFWSEESGSSSLLGYASGMAIQPFEWHHLAVVRDPATSEWSIVLDGQSLTPTMVGGLLIAPALAPSGPATIGALDIGYQPFQGLIDEVRLWNVARTPQQIADAMHWQTDTAEPWLQAWYSADERQGGLLRDWSGNGFDAQLVGEAGFVAPPRTGLVFDGVDDAIEFSTDTNLRTPSTAISFAAWVRLDSTDSLNHGLLTFGESVDNDNGDPTEPWAVESFMFEHRSTVGLRMRLQNGPNANFVDIYNSADPVLLDENRWHHLAFTWSSDGSGSVGNIYVDGELAYQQTAPAGTIAYSDTAELALGRWFWNDSTSSSERYTHGAMADVSLWSRELSALEVRQNMHSALAGDESGLIGYWPMRENAGTTVADLSSSANHGSLSGAVDRQDFLPDILGAHILTPSGTNSWQQLAFADFLAPTPLTEGGTSAYSFGGSTAGLAHIDPQRGHFQLQAGSTPASVQALDESSGLQLDASVLPLTLASFQTGAGSATTVLIDPGTTLSQPADPSLTGHIFGGWYSDPAYGTLWNFADPVTTSLELFAKWTPEQYSIDVVLDTVEGAVSGPGIYNYGDSVTLSATANPGYAFEHWVQEGGDTSETSTTLSFTALQDRSLQAVFSSLPSLAISGGSALEGALGETTEHSLTLSLDKLANGDVSLNYQTLDGSADSTEDYLPASGTLTIPHGQLTGAINVAVIGDDIPESHETFEVRLTSPSANAQFAGGAASLSAIWQIENDDAALISWYPFDYGSFADYSGNGADLVENGTVSLNLGAAAFEPDGNYLKASNLVPSAIDAFTYAFWIKAGTQSGLNSAGGEQYILMQSVAAGQTSSVHAIDMAYTTTAPELRAWDEAGDTYSVSMSSPVTVLDNQWHHLAFVNSTGLLNGLKIYIDGQEIPGTLSGAGSSAFRLQPDLYFGTRSDLIGDTRFDFTGLLDDIRIYDQALDSADVDSLFQAGRITSTALNLLTNPGAEEGLTGWNQTLNGGDGWLARNWFPRTGGYCFGTSSSLDVQSQEVDLIAAGYDAAELDAGTLPINVGLALRARDDDGLYFVRAELRDETGSPLESWVLGSQASLQTLTPAEGWVYKNYEFTNYPAGVRRVFLEYGGEDTVNWAGHFGVHFDDAAIVVGY